MLDPSLADRAALLSDVDSLSERVRASEDPSVDPGRRFGASGRSEGPSRAAERACVACGSHSLCASFCRARLALSDSRFRPRFELFAEPNGHTQ